jgi:Diguanylate cyclase, GGDEF domain
MKCQDPHAVPIAKHAEALNGVPSYFEYRHGNRHFAVHVGPLRGVSGGITGCVGAGIDITDRKKSEDQARYQATHDALTGLANYREFVDTLEREVRRAERSNHSFALLLKRLTTGMDTWREIARLGDCPRLSRTTLGPRIWRRDMEATSLQSY